MARDAGWMFHVAKAVLSPAFKFGWRYYVRGLENVPEEGPAIIAPNHVSVLDSFFVPLVLPRRITYVGKSEYLDDWKTKYLFPAMGMVPIDRSGGESGSAALDAACKILDRGELFGIYPEGTRSRDGRLHRGHTGVSRLAVRTGAPIIPVGIRGSREVMPPDARFPRPFLPVHISFGRPIRVRDPGRTDDHHLLFRQIADEVMYEVRELSGQEYVDAYATKKAEGMPTPTAVLTSAGGPPESPAVQPVLDGVPEPRRSSAALLRS